MSVESSLDISSGSKAYNCLMELENELTLGPEAKNLGGAAPMANVEGLFFPFRFYKT